MACPRVTGKPCDEIAPKDARVDPIRSILMMNFDLKNAAIA